MHPRTALTIVTVLLFLTACGSDRPTPDDVAEAALPTLAALDGTEARDAADCLAQVVDRSELSDAAVLLVVEELRNAGETGPDAAQVMVETDLGAEAADEEALSDVADDLDACLPLSAGRPSREDLAEQLVAQASESMPIDAVVGACIAEIMYASDLSDDALRGLTGGEAGLATFGDDLRGDDRPAWEAVTGDVLECVPGPAGVDRPSIDEIARSVAEAAGPDLLTESQAYCFAQVVHASGISDDTLQRIADGSVAVDGSSGVPEADALQFESLEDELAACLTA
ncbi:hypothetical protein [Aeromicrobium sp. Leaf350]|uniref:hypothetical protein n=1 Tax=Aeromicrobium sp. Leaf350 TaxID=2876565 RepID=UPI001E4D451F|nr:hypothetical protein [Aeromicrobium sp. Leaf350]